MGKNRLSGARAASSSHFGSRRCASPRSRGLPAKVCVRLKGLRIPGPTVAARDVNPVKGVPPYFALSLPIPNCLKTCRFLVQEDIGCDSLVNEFGAEVGADCPTVPQRGNRSNVLHDTYRDSYRRFPAASLTYPPHLRNTPMCLRRSQGIGQRFMRRPRGEVEAP